MFDGESFGEEIVASVKAHVASSIAPLLSEITALKAKVLELESRQPLKGEPGKDGRDGRDVDRSDIIKLQEEFNNLDLHYSALIEEVNEYKKQKPERGEKGDPGKDGESIQGPPGKDGVGIASAFIDREGNLVLTFTDGTVGSVGKVAGERGQDGAPGLNGKDGKDGIDGVGIDDVHEEMDADGRTLIRRWKGGDTVKEFRHKAHFLKWLGVFKSGEKYDFQDAVTSGGAIWICQRETSERPEIGCKDWVLAVKKGRDGKDGERGPPGPTGERGKDGRDLTQMDFSGAKF